MGTIEIPDPGHRTWDCIGVGVCALDFLSVLDRYPQSNEKTEVVESRIQGGGPVPTAMYALGKYGWMVGFVGLVGRDWGGEIIVQGLESAEVDVSSMVQDADSRTAHAFIWVDRRNGNRTVSLDRTRIRNVTVDEMPLDWIRDSRLLLCDGRETEANIVALEAARESGTITVFDASSKRQQMHRILSMIDFPVVSRDFLRSVLGTSDLFKGLDALLEYGAQAAVITLGEQGCVWKARDGANGKETAYQVEVKDTTGAGDLFHAGFIHGLLSGWSIDLCCRFGCAAAALKCRELGGQPGVVSANKVSKWMKTAPRYPKKKRQQAK